MLTSLAIIFLVGMSLASIFEHLKLPKIIGIIISGIFLGPHILNLLDPETLKLSSELRKMALVIILLRAGISLNLKELKKVGIQALLLSTLPSTCEILAFSLIGPILLPITRLEGAIIGSILGAVSPAIVVPKMLFLIEKKYGTSKKIPQLIVTGASMDDVYAIVLFTTFVSIEQGGSGNLLNFVTIPVSIICGVSFGFFVGKLFSIFLENRYKHDDYIRNSKKLILLLGLAFLMIAIEEFVKPFPFSGLLAVMAMANSLKLYSSQCVSSRISEKLEKVWIASEVILFVLVGASIDIAYTLNAGVFTVLMIFIALLFRSVGVFIAMTGINATLKEKLFCMISYLPKATVQAVIGSVPLSLGLRCGPLALSIAVIAILITAPMGAILIECTYKKLLSQEI